MNAKEIRERVERIRAMSGDNEVAHGMEDVLMQQFIIVVSNEGSPELREMAEEVMKVWKIDFERWYA